MGIEIDYKLFHQRQDRRSNITFSLNALPLEQKLAGGFEDSLIFTRPDYSQYTAEKAPRNPVPHPERLQLVDLPLPFPKKGIIYRDEVGIVAD